MKEITKIVIDAIELCTPKIKARTLPYPEIDEDMLEKIREVNGGKTLIYNGIKFMENKRKLNRLREELREKWKEKRENMWRELIAKTDIERNPRVFWKQIGRMMGKSREKQVEIYKNENGVGQGNGGNVENSNRIKDENGRLAVEETEMRRILKEYYEDLYIIDTKE